MWYILLMVPDIISCLPKYTSQSAPHKQPLPYTPIRPNNITVKPDDFHQDDTTYLYLFVELNSP